MNDEEWERLCAAAVRINQGRIGRGYENSARDEPAVSPAEYWRAVFDEAIREVARKNAQLAAAGLEGGSIHIAQRKVNGGKAVGCFVLAFLDGLVLRRPELVVSVFKDRSVIYEWIGNECCAGHFDPGRDVRSQVSELVVRLCELVA